MPSPDRQCATLRVLPFVSRLGTYLLMSVRCHRCSKAAAASSFRPHSLGEPWLSP